MECSPLQAVGESCRSLKKEWEGMLQKAETVFSDAFSSLEFRERELMAEKAETHSLVQEVGILRQSLRRHLQDEEHQSHKERDSAKQISENICNQWNSNDIKMSPTSKDCYVKGFWQVVNLKSITKSDCSEDINANSEEAIRLSRRLQFMQVKEMQDQIASQLLKLRSSLRSLETQKPDDMSGKSMALSNIQSSVAAAGEGISIMKRNFEVKSECLDIISNTDNNKEEECETRYQEKDKLDATGRSVLEQERFCGDFITNRASFNSMVVKEEPQDESLCLEKYMSSKGAIEDVDQLDHVVLSNRLKLFRKNIDSKCQYTKEEKYDAFTDSAECNMKNMHKLIEYDPEMHSRKRRRGSENLFPTSKHDVPIKIALQEDAPGLLEKLEEKGLLQDMVMYCACCDDDWCRNTDQFKDLECISSRAWGTPSGLIKFTQPHTLRHNASSLGKTPAYCLSCLVCLIDQTRTLRSRGWPVEWGWCRQLQAFIFVFDKHNRIILERPEYGNATYFFELVESQPVTWQVTRLIKVLCAIPLNKTSILENRPLQVGYELTVDESRVLESYGWTPDTGLGTFLNFCDRVIHDVKDDDNYEWRQKLGKCLMDGYDKGRITMHCTPVLSNISTDVENDEDIKPKITFS